MDRFERDTETRTLLYISRFAAYTEVSHAQVDGGLFGVFSPWRFATMDAVSYAGIN